MPNKRVNPGKSPTTFKYGKAPPWVRVNIQFECTIYTFAIQHTIYLYIKGTISINVFFILVCNIYLCRINYIILDKLLKLTIHLRFIRNVR